MVCTGARMWKNEDLVSFTISLQHSESLLSQGLTKRTSGSSLTSLSTASLTSLNSPNRGEIRMALHLSTSNKSKSESVLEHKRLLRVLLSYELMKRNSTPFSWRDDFCKEALEILAQHAIQAHLTREDTALARWLVYNEIHSILPLDYRVFTPVLDKLRSHVKSEDISKDFHEAADGFASHCLSFIKRHRKHLAGKGSHEYHKFQEQLRHILQCLHVIHCLQWRTKYDIVLRVEDAIRTGVQEWLHFVDARLDLSPDKTVKDPNIKMKEQIRLTHILIADLMSCKQIYGDMFAESLNIDYSRISFRVYDQHLSRRARTVVEEVCSVFKPLTFPDTIESGFEDFHVGKEEQDEISNGTTMFELYLALQQFYQLGVELSENAQDLHCSASDSGAESSSGSESTHQDECRAHHYYKWFSKAVAKWLDIALFKAMKRIMKAVELDELQPVDTMVQHTSSAVDIRTVFAQIGTFWHQLKWPDPESGFVFISRILDDVCRAAIFYAERMKRKVDHLEKSGTIASIFQQKSETAESDQVFFTRPQCLAINNIEFVLGAIQPFLADLGIAEVLLRLEERNGGLVADVCKKSVKTMVKNALENIENQIHQALLQLCSRMSPVILEYLTETLQCDTLPLTRFSHDRLLQFLDENLIFLRDSLIPANFDRALTTLWSTSARVISSTIEEGIQEKCPQSHFSRLYHIFRVLINFFFGESFPKDTGLPKINRLLKLYSCHSQALVQHYISTRLAQQRAIPLQSYPFGSVTVRALMQASHLRVEIMNARHLKPTDFLLRERETRKGLCNKTQTTLSTSGSCVFDDLITLLPPTVTDDPKDKDTNNGIMKTLRCYPRNTSSTSEADRLTFIKSKFDSVRLTVQEAHVLMQKSFGAGGGQCDPYVTVQIIPHCGSSASVKKVKTKVQSRTLFPLYDETFDLVFTEDEVTEDHFLLISVKDKGVMGEGVFLGEAFLPLKEIITKDLSQRLQDLPQLQLPLTRPSAADVALEEILFAIETRASDPRVRQFWRKEKRKMLF